MAFIGSGALTHPEMVGLNPEYLHELMWGGARVRASRGPKPELTLGTVVEAATHIADKESLSSVTMSCVAAELGVTTMALYRYVPGKDQLLDLMIDAALGSPPAARGQHWRSEVTAWARASLAMFHARPWLLEAVLSRAPIGPNWLAWLNAGLRALAGSGLGASDMPPAVLLIDGHVRAAAQVSLNATGTSEWAQSFAKALQQASADPRYSALAAVMHAGGFGASSSPTSFEFGLERILDGIERFVETRPAIAVSARTKRKNPKK